MTSVTGRLLHWPDSLKKRKVDTVPRPPFRQPPGGKRENAANGCSGRLKEDLPDCKLPPRQGFSRIITGGYGISIAPPEVRPEDSSGWVGSDPAFAHGLVYSFHFSQG